MVVDSIVGQSSLIKRLQAILGSDTVVHAYLFTGPEGIGKKTFAGFFAQAILCENRGDKPCGVCRSCRMFITGNHPDTAWVRLLEDKKEIIKEQIMDMQSDIKIKPYYSDRKIYFIDKANLMNKSAQNAFLKTLEEPPSYALILLLADSIGSFNPTILSRCQIININRLSDEETARILADRLALDQKEALIYGRMSQGVPGKVLMLASNYKLKELRERMLDTLNGPDDFSMLDMLDIFIKNKDLFNELLDILALWYRDLILLKINNRNIVNVDKISLLHRQANVFTIDDLKVMIEKIENCRVIANSSGNYPMTIENMLMGLQEGIFKCRLL